ncbi:MAG TPA: VTT domain-containing protein [Verrucomicrobiales bacterium]|nr:VTT domain-containing protein [Verrucomicrobiales bacterium]
MRLLWLALFLALFFLALALPFVLRENDPELLLSEAGARSLLDEAGRWAWLAALALLIGDLLLPVPATAVMSALGYLYGVALGGIIGAAGSIASGLSAYGLCRALGPRAAEKLVGKKDLARGQVLFRRAGGWVVALSRWLPVLSEVAGCLAGLTRMPFPRFAIAVACGSVPMAFAFAAVGSAGIEHPAVALGLSAGAPALLWGAAAFLLRRQRSNEEEP